MVYAYIDSIAPTVKERGNVDRPPRNLTMDTNDHQRHLNALLYGAPPSVEVAASEAWDYLATDDADWKGYYYPEHCGVKVLKSGVRLTRTEYEWIPDEQAIKELKSLMARWRKRGLKNYVASIEVQEDADGEEYSVYESLGHSKQKRVTKTLPFSAVKFYKELPYDPLSGLRHALNEPRTNARITGLSTHQFLS